MPLGSPFWAYWSATSLANLGDGIRLAAFPLLAAQLTDNPFLVGAVAAVSGLPWLLTGLMAGSMADRFGPRLPFGVLNVAAAGLRYRMVRGELLGRVSAAWRTSAYVASAAGALAGGAAAAARGLTAPFVLSVVLGGIATLIWFLGTRADPAPA